MQELRQDRVYAIIVSWCEKWISERALLCLAVVVFSTYAALQIADVLTTTLFVLDKGIEREAHLQIKQIFFFSGFAGLWAVKLIPLCGLLALFTYSLHLVFKHPKERKFRIILIVFILALIPLDLAYLHIVLANIIFGLAGT